MLSARLLSLVLVALDKAIFTTRDAQSGTEDARVLVREGDTWKFDIEASENIKQDKK